MLMLLLLSIFADAWRNPAPAGGDPSIYMGLAASTVISFFTLVTP